MKTFADLLESSGPKFGTWAELASGEAAEMLGFAGFDFAIVDMEHGSIGIETAEAMMRGLDAAGAVPLVRVARNDRAEITKVLDAGAAAVVVPGISSVDEAKAAIAATRWAPHGTRGANPCVRSARQMTWDWLAYRRQREAETGAIIMVESRAGVEAIEAIVHLPGIMGLAIGPFDLSVSLGHNGQHQHAEVQAAIARMIATAVAAKVPVMLPLFSVEPQETARQMHAWSAQGVRLFTVGTDKILFMDACRRQLAALKASG